MKIPSWVSKLVIGALVTAIVAWTLSWAGDTSRTQTTHTAEIAVLKTDQENTKETMKEVKQSQRRIEDKLDQVLARRR